MKLPLLFIALAISHVVFSQEEEGEINIFEEDDRVIGGWSSEDLTELNADSDYREILNLGVRHAIAKGIQSGKLHATNYYVEDVLSFETQFASGMNYRFITVLGNGEGNEITVNFTVNDNFWTGARDVISYEFVENSRQEVLIDVNKLCTDKDLNNILRFGVQDVITKGIEDNHLLTSNYQPSKIYSIKVSGTNYRFNLRLENDKGGYAHIIIIVYDPCKNPIESREVKSYYFFDIQDGESWPALIVPFIHHEDPEDETIGVWTPIDLVTLNTDSYFRDIADSGLQDGISKGSQDEKFYDAIYGPYHERRATNFLSWSHNNFYIFW